LFSLHPVPLTALSQPLRRVGAPMMPGFDSRRFIVGSDTEEAFAKSCDPNPA
jgi:hypothetical protein